MKILILEDDPERVKKFRQQLIGNEVTVVDQAPACIEHLRNSTFDLLFLDHDLGGKVYVPSGPGTGYEVACWLHNNLDRRSRLIIVHSLSSFGAENICKVLPRAVRLPHAWMYDLSPLLI